MLGKSKKSLLLTSERMLGSATLAVSLLFCMLAMPSTASAHGAVPGMYIKDSYSKRCLALQNNNTANRTPIQMWDCNGTLAQWWGSYLGVTGPIEIGGWGYSRKVVDAPYTADYSTTWIFDWWGGDNQKWSMPRIELVSKTQGNKCVTVGASQGNNVSTASYTYCNGSASQKWFHDYNSGQIRSSDGRCLGVQDNLDPSSIAFVTVRPCTSSVNQHWHLVSNPNLSASWLQINFNSQGARCVTQWSFMTADPLLVLGPCDGSIYTKFFGRGQIVGYQSGKCLQMPRRSGGIISANGTPPELYSCNGDIAQQWEFYW